MAYVEDEIHQDYESFSKGFAAGTQAEMERARQRQANAHNVHELMRAAIAKDAAVNDSADFAEQFVQAIKSAVSSTPNFAKRTQMQANSNRPALDADAKVKCRFRRAASWCIFEPKPRPESTLPDCKATPRSSLRRRCCGPAMQPH